MEYTDRQGTKFTIRSAERVDFLRVNQICESRFGKGYLSEAEFEKWIIDADFCKVAVYDGVVEGIVYLMPEDAKTLAKSLKLDENYVLNVSGGKKVIHCRCGAIDKDFERRGIMVIVLDEIIDSIKKTQEFGAIFAPAWTYNNFTPMGKILNGFGFEFIGEKQNLWDDLEDYTCIVCKGKCRCKASIYQKKI